MPRFNLDELPDKYQDQAKERLGLQEEIAKRNKYGNRKTVDTETGEAVDSKLEAKHRAMFRTQMRAGLIMGYASQVEIMLPGGIKMIVDHMTVDFDRRMVFYDSKGAEPTRDWKNKKKLAAAQGIEVEVIKK